MEKVCNKCNKSKSLSEFYSKNNKCKSCFKEYCRLRRKNITDEVIRIKEASPCLDCGKFFPYYCMDFDHCESKGEKSHTINWMIKQRSSLKMIKLEIDKCELICSNCHRKRTFSRIQDENSKR